MLLWRFHRERFVVPRHCRAVDHPAKAEEALQALAVSGLRLADQVLREKGF
jgi:hypothetical protein